MTRRVISTPREAGALVVAVTSSWFSGKLLMQDVISTRRTRSRWQLLLRGSAASSLCETSSLPGGLARDGSYFFVAQRKLLIRDDISIRRTRSRSSSARRAGWRPGRASAAHASSRSCQRLTTARTAAMPRRAAAATGCARRAETAARLLTVSRAAPTARPSR